MTLIVGLKCGDRLELMSDTAITDPHESRRNVLPGRLKATVVSEWLAVAHAGLTDWGLDAVRSLPRVPVGNRELDAVLEHLLVAHRKSEKRVDFIVIADLENPRLVKISSDRIFEGSDRHWIGNSDGAHEFALRLESAPRPADVEEELAHLATAIQSFNSIVDDQSVEGVGGLMFRVSKEKDGLNYALGASVFYPPQTIPGSEWTSLKFGTAVHGGFAYSVMVPATPGIPAVGAYFLQGRLGLFYQPLSSDEPVEYPRVSQEGFERQVLAAHGVQLHGLGLG